MASTRDAATCASPSSPPQIALSGGSPRASAWSPMARCSWRTAKPRSAICTVRVDSRAIGLRNPEGCVMGFLEFPIRRYQFTLVAFLCLVALGWYAFASVPREEDPYFKIPGFTIAAIYPGADPKDLERLVAKPHRGPLRRARRRDEDRDLDPRRRVVHRHRVPGLRRRRQEIRRGDARGERAAAGVPAGSTQIIDPPFFARPGEHRADRAGVRGRALPRARRLRARAQGHAQDRRRRAHRRKAGRIRRASCASRWTCGAWRS